jgi:hypothetical protein
MDTAVNTQIILQEGDTLVVYMGDRGNACQSMDS